MRIVSFLLCCCASAGVLAQSLSGQDVLEGLGVPEKDRQQLEQGGILAYDGEAYEGTPRELAADAMILIDAPLGEVMDQVREVGSIIPTKYLVEYRDIESRDDFADVAFDAGELKEADKLLNARRGKDLNLSDDELALLSTYREKANGLGGKDRVELASDAMREILVGRYEAYRARGLEGISEYRRSKRKSIDIGAELTLTTETFEPFEPDMPDYYRVMRHFPDGADCCEHMFRWMKVKLRKRPAFALTHTIIQKTDDLLLITERHYYVSHTINSVQVTVSWIPYDEDTYMGLAVSASADILDSMMGRMLRPLGRNKARDLVADVLDEFRQDLQSEEDNSSAE